MRTLSWLLFCLLLAAPLAAEVFYPPLIGEVYLLNIKTAPAVFNEDGVRTTPPTASIGILDRDTRELIKCLEWSAEAEVIVSVEVAVLSTGAVRVLQVAAFAEVACTVTPGLSEPSSPATNEAGVFPGVPPNPPIVVVEP